MQYNERVRKGVHRLTESLAVQSIVLYWAIAFCSWEDGHSIFTKFHGSEDVLLEEALLDELFEISSESPTIDSLVPLTVMELVVPLRPGQWWLGKIDFGYLIHDWSLKVLKTSSIGSFNRVKCSVDFDWTWRHYGEHLLFLGGYPLCHSGTWSGASRVDFDFCSVLAKLCWRVGGSFHDLLQLDEWPHPERASIILATLCFRRCLYKGWVTYNPLINTSAYTSSLQLETLESWLWKELMQDLRLSPGLILTERGGGGYSSLLLGTYCVRKASVIPKNLWKKRGDRE